MKTLTRVFLIVGLLLQTFISSADITSWSYRDDGDGAFVCSTTNFSGADLSMLGTLNWSPGHMVGTIGTDTLIDPTITLSSTVNNGTAFAWAALDVNVYMNHSFTLTPGLVALPPGWTASLTQAPIPNPTPSFFPALEYKGTLTLSGPGDIPVGGGTSFSYQLTFSDSLSYTFVQEMVPLAVPEPAGLLGLGGLLLLCARRRR